MFRQYCCQNGAGRRTRLPKATAVYVMARITGGYLSSRNNFKGSMKYNLNVSHLVGSRTLPFDGSRTKIERSSCIVSGRNSSSSKNCATPVKTRNHRVDRHPNLSFKGPPMIGAWIRVAIRGKYNEWTCQRAEIEPSQCMATLLGDVDIRQRARTHGHNRCATSCSQYSHNDQLGHILRCGAEHVEYNPHCERDDIDCSSTNAL